MRYRILVAAALLIAPNSVLAQEPIGEWLVADGGARIRIVDCDGTLWGVVAWEKTPGRDTNNPNPDLRNRPTLGMPVLLDMRPDKPGRWKGKVYNSENGNTYDASIALTGDKTLHIEGCALGILCGGEDWRRTASTVGAASRRKSQTTVCSILGVGAGRSHQDRLK